MNMKKIYFVITVALAFGIAMVPEIVLAAEDGVGHYIPGAFADFSTMAPESGGAFMDWYLHYNGSVNISKQIEFGGIVAAGARAAENVELFGLAYTLPCAILGGKYTAALVADYIWEDVTGTFTGPFGRSLTRTDATSGVGDTIIIPFWLGWNKGECKWNTQLNIYAPTGAFDVGQLANTGLNYWTFEPMVSFSAISRKIGLEVSFNAALDFNTNNNDTNYHSGEIFHFDGTIAEHLPLCTWGIFGVGVNGYYWKQFSPDAGSGAKLGSFETLQTGVGPVLSYISPPFCGNHTIVAEVKWLPQIDTRYTLSGNYVWGKLSLTF